MVGPEKITKIADMCKELTQLNSPHAKTLAGMLKSLSDRRCTLCQGVGHHIKQCPLIIKMNKMSKVPGPLKKSWGTYKGKKLLANTLTLIGMQSKASLTNLETEITTNLDKKLAKK